MQPEVMQTAVPLTLRSWMSATLGELRQLDGSVIMLLLAGWKRSLLNVLDDVSRNSITRMLITMKMHAKNIKEDSTHRTLSRRVRRFHQGGFLCKSLKESIIMLGGWINTRISNCKLYSIYQKKQNEQRSIILAFIESDCCGMFMLLFKFTAVVGEDKGPSDICSPPVSFIVNWLEANAFQWRHTTRMNRTDWQNVLGDGEYWKTRKHKSKEKCSLVEKHVDCSLLVCCRHRVLIWFARIWLVQTCSRRRITATQTCSALWNTSRCKLILLIAFQLNTGSLRFFRTHSSVSNRFDAILGRCWNNRVTLIGNTRWIGTEWPFHYRRLDRCSRQLAVVLWRDKCIISKLSL